MEEVPQHVVTLLCYPYGSASVLKVGGARYRSGHADTAECQTIDKHSSSHVCDVDCTPHVKAAIESPSGLHVKSPQIVCRTLLAGIQRRLYDKKRTHAIAFRCGRCKRSVSQQDVDGAVLPSTILCSECLSEGVAAYHRKRIRERGEVCDKDSLPVALLTPKVY